MSCRDVRDWLHRDASSLDEAQRLLLDDHLAACDSCRGDRDRLRIVQRIGTSLPVPPPNAREVNRAIARALMAGPSDQAAPPRRPWWIVPALAVTAIAAIAVVVATRHRDEPAPREAHRDVTPAPPPHVPTPPDVVEDVVEAGSLIGDTATIAAGAAVPANVALRTAGTTRVKLGALHVVIAASSEIRWSPIDRELVLDRGSLELDANAGPTRIVTPQFEVELEDAALTVEPAEVRMHRGTARVVDRSRKLLASLDGDGAWRPLEPAIHTPGVKPAELLARARTQFAAKDYAGAERTATRALTGASRSEAAEARIFLADVAQAAGKLDLAVVRYEQVATKYADLPAAESALYDAARIELQRSHATEARRFLDRYLTRYPSGRYADDVHRDLAKLP